MNAMQSAGLAMEPSYTAAFDNLPWQSTGVGARHKQVALAGRQLRLLELTPALVHPDWCAKGHAGYVLEGRLELRFRTGAVQCHAGEGFLIPAGEEHAHIPRALTDRVTLFVVDGE
ncbi:MAG TPA: cupin domain-containing protein [Beijerinckiaceae bacterium]|jgi:quercetin dioxygenase-like cupin family protein